ncbi:hypothetical protein DFH28DRAFT_931914 [Melampsora americana]|nr:hypothetical protein DFH28DRAFT_931914 [Melampsora americana]
MEGAGNSNERIEEKGSNMAGREVGTTVEIEGVDNEQGDIIKESEGGKGGSIEIEGRAENQHQNLDNSEIEIVDQLINAPVNKGKINRGRMTGLAYQGDIARYDLIQREYERWCLKNKTQICEIDLFEMDVDSTPLPIINSADKPKDISKPKKETNTKMEFGELL